MLHFNESDNSTLKYPKTKRGYSKYRNESFCYLSYENRATTSGKTKESATNLQDPAVCRRYPFIHLGGEEV